MPIRLLLLCCLSAVACAGSMPEPEPAIAEGRSGILFRHGHAIGTVEPREDLMLGTHAAWTPAYDGIIYATARPPQRLILRRFLADGGERDRELPVPPVQTKLPLNWQWSISENGRWLLVRRVSGFRWQQRADEVREEERRIAWHGLIDLQTLTARQVEPFSGIIGWQDGRAIVRSSDVTQQELFLLDPRRQSHRRSLGEIGSISELSPDGRLAIVWESRDGVIIINLQELGGDVKRRLYERGFSEAGGLYGRFFSGGQWLATAVAVRPEHGEDWAVTVQVSAVDAPEILYEDVLSYRHEDVGHSGLGGTLSAAPAGDNVCYWRFEDGSHPATLVLLTIRDGEVQRSDFPQRVMPLADHRFPMLWSPDGMEVAWLVPHNLSGGFGIVRLSVESGESRVIGYLPGDAVFWTWSTPAVAFPHALP